MENSDLKGSLVGDPLRPRPTSDELEPAECFGRLSQESVGRIVYTEGAMPAVVPVRYSIDGQRVRFRLPTSSGLRNAISGMVVAFEADQLLGEERSGWMVVVTGIALADRVPKRVRGATIGLDSPGLDSPDPDSPANDADEVFVLTQGRATGRCIEAL